MKTLGVLILTLFLSASAVFHDFDNMEQSERQKYLGEMIDPEVEALVEAAKSKVKASGLLTMGLPLNFTISDKWPMCKSVFETIQDQSKCGSCWAVSTASVLSDRRCIKFKRPMPPISAWDIASCCKSCSSSSTNGCNGGSSFKALQYFFRKGAVTGGMFGSNVGCKPYQIDPNATIEIVARCKTKCRSGFKKSPRKAYKKDKKFGKKNVKLFSRDNNAVMDEIYNNGPVVAVFKVYKDFYKYKGGIYKQYSKAGDGSHAVRLVGWGVSPNGTKYWRVANSWGTDWGEGGYFNILRDTNECDFETKISSAMVMKKKKKKAKKSKK